MRLERGDGLADVCFQRPPRPLTPLCLRYDPLAPEAAGLAVARAVV